MGKRARWLMTGMIVGGAAGFLAGARAGSAANDRITAGLQRVRSDPRVRSATNSARDQAIRLYQEARRRVGTDRLAFVDDADALDR